MSMDYKRTFNAVKISGKSQEKIRSDLSSRLSEAKKEDTHMNKKIYNMKKSRIAVVAALAILSLSLVGFTFADKIISLLGGGQIVQGKNEDGSDFVSIDTGFISEPVKVEDGRIYFILDGSDKDITDQCSASEYFKYEKTDDNGYRHVIVVGGTSENVGTAEFVWGDSGVFTGSNASYGSGQEPAWLEAAKADLLKSDTP